jgi:hypothetical protein
MRSLGWVAALVLGGCAKEKPLAPTEMVDIVRYMFAEWEDPEALAAAVDNIDPWMSENATSEEAKEGFRLNPLESGDVAGVDHPNRDLALLIGAAGGTSSKHPLRAQAEHIVLADQTFANPSQYKLYARDIVEGSVSGFKGGEGLVRTVNEVETSNWGISIPYTLYKDYVWIQGEAAEAIVGRSWTEARSCNDSGKNCINQSFSVDLFHWNGSETLRLTATWSEVESSINLSDELLIAGLADGIQKVFEGTEAHLDE